MGKKGLAKTTPKRRKMRKREANKQHAASHLVLRWKGAAKKSAKVTNEYAEVVWVSFLYFLFLYVFNVHLNCGGSDYAPVRSIAPFSNLNFFVKNRQKVFAIELMNFINSIAKNSNFAFFLRIFDEFFSGFRAKFQKIVTCVAFSIKFVKTKLCLTN